MKTWRCGKGMPAAKQGVPTVPHLEHPRTVCSRRSRRNRTKKKEKTFLAKTSTREGLATRGPDQPAQVGSVGLKRHDCGKKRESGKEEGRPVLARGIRLLTE